MRTALWVAALFIVVVLVLAVVLGVLTDTSQEWPRKPQPVKNGNNEGGDTGDE